MVGAVARKFANTIFQSAISFAGRNTESTQTFAMDDIERGHTAERAHVRSGQSEAEQLLSFSHRCRLLEQRQSTEQCVEEFPVVARLSIGSDQEPFDCTEFDECRTDLGNGSCIALAVPDATDHTGRRFLRILSASIDGRRILQGNGRWHGQTQFQNRKSGTGHRIRVQIAKLHIVGRFRFPRHHHRQNTEYDSFTDLHL